MLYIANIKKRYFDTVLENGTILNIEAPSVRNVTTLTDIVKNPKDYGMNEVIELVSEIMSSNKENVPVTKAYIIDNFSYDTLREFISAYMKWVKTGERSPN